VNALCAFAGDFSGFDVLVHGFHRGSQCCLHRGGIGHVAQSRGGVGQCAPIRLDKKATTLVRMCRSTSRPASVMATSTIRPSDGSLWRSTSPRRSSRETITVIDGWLMPS
jgi:hypothetical protein